MLGALFGIGQQAGAVIGVFAGGAPARTGACDRPDRHLAVARAHQYLGARPRQREARQVEVVQERRRVDPPERTVEIERRQRVGHREALGKHDLKNIARHDIGFRARHHVGVATGFQCGLPRCRFLGYRCRTVASMADLKRSSEYRHRRLDPVDRVVDPVAHPDRCRDEQPIGEPVEHQNHRRPHEQHIGQVERVGRRARQGFDEPNRFITEIAD